MQLDRFESRRIAPSVFIQEFDIQKLIDPLHEHSYFELVYISAGSGHWQLGTKTGEFAPGTLLLVPPRSMHKWESVQVPNVAASSSGIVVYFSKACLPPSLLSLPEMKPLSELVSESVSGLQFKVSDHERLKARLRSIHRANGALRLSRFYVALELIAGYARVQIVGVEEIKNSMTPKSLARFESAKRLVEERFYSDLSRSEIAQKLGVDEASFSRFFRSASGVTFVDYLASLRIRHAAKLLGSRRDLSVSEVAQKSGFRNLSAFHRQFKKRLGTTPNAYRSAANQELLAP